MYIRLKYKWVFCKICIFEILNCFPKESNHALILAYREVTINFEI